MEELRRYKEDVEEARRIRRERADWDFINSLPPKLKIAMDILHRDRGYQKGV